MYAYGDARNEGGAGGTVRPDPVVGAAATPDGAGYWLVTASGQVLAFGDARSQGSITEPVRGQVVGIVATTDGRGYWIATSTGRVFNFGDAKFYGSFGAHRAGRPIAGMAATPDDGGYWLADTAGRIFSYGDAATLSSTSPLPARSPVVSLAVTPDGRGAWLAERNGTVLSFGDAIAHGSLAAVRARYPVISIATILMPSTLSYDLAESDGKVRSVGRAAYYGSLYGKHLTAPIVSLVPTPDGRGYWLIGADGGVYAFGDARNAGGAGGKPRSDPVVAAAATPDGGGYWLVTSSGRVMAFGDARNFGSITAPIKDRVVGIVATTEGNGYWIACSTGGVFTFGDARYFGSAKATARLPVVAMAATPDDGGYMLADANGHVFRLGDALRLPTRFSPVKPKSPVVGIAVTPGGTRDWIAEQNGTVFNFGVATARGSPIGVSTKSPVTSIAAMPVSDAPPLRYPSGAVGYDVNWPQCVGETSSIAAALPGPPTYPAGTRGYTVAVVGVDGWAVGARNPCLRAEVQWAAKATGTRGARYDLYMFLNSPTASDTINQRGPAGICNDISGARHEMCLAYNFGYNSARIAVNYATSQGASSSVWWIDVENDSCGQYWSCNQTLNSLTIQGSIDFLHSQRVTAGIYSTARQWQAITGGYVPTGPQVPIWVAGAYWTSPPYPASYGYLSPAVLSAYCGPEYAFAGGQTWLLQETPGPNNYPFDPDYAC